MKKDMTAMLKMFNLIDIGECAGSGIPNIFRVWRGQGWIMPDIAEQLEPERTILTLKFEKTADKKPAIKVGGKKTAIKIGGKKSAINVKTKESIIAYLTDKPEAKASSIAEFIGLKPSRTRDYLNELIVEGIVVAGGENKNRIYKLNPKSLLSLYAKTLPPNW